MCNLYKMTKTVAEVAKLFGAAADPPGNAGDTVYPGYPGIVVAPDGDGLLVRQMIWGFPLVLKGKNGQPLKPKPVNNCRTDKLDGGFWRPSFHARRCLIPVTAFCEAEGEKGAKTRTWFSLPGEELFGASSVGLDGTSHPSCRHLARHGRMGRGLFDGDDRGVRACELGWFGWASHPNWRPRPDAGDLAGERLGGLARRTAGCGGVAVPAV